jgi:maleylpyruvate isomerase
MPAEAWQRIVQWTAGQEHPAYRAADARLTEVLIHHADLDAGYRPRDWPAEFTTSTLASVAAGFDRRPDAPPMRLHAADTGRSYDVHPDAGAPAIRGTQTALLAWLMGRSPGDDLTTTGTALPKPPHLY